MNARSVTLPLSQETPIETDSLFLLRRENRDFLTGNTDIPVLRTPASPLSVIGSMAIMGSGCGWFALSLRTYIPLLAALSPGTLILLFTLIGAILGIGLMWNDKRGTHRWRGVATHSLSSYTPVVLEGEVIEAEKVRSWHWYGTTEKVFVRYRFTTPHGVIAEGHAVGLLKDTTHDMVPLPGILVFVWYCGGDQFYLL